MRDQDLSRLRVVLLGGPDERGFSICFAPRVHVGAVLDEQAHDLGTPRASGRHQNGALAGSLCIGIRACVQQRFGHGRVPIRGGQRERCHTVAVGGLGIGTRVKQALRCREVVVIDGPFKRRGSVCIGGIGGQNARRE